MGVKSGLGSVFEEPFFGSRLSGNFGINLALFILGIESGGRISNRSTLSNPQQTEGDEVESSHSSLTLTYYCDHPNALINLTQ